MIFENCSSIKFGETLSYIKQFILDAEDWETFSEILFEKMRKINRIYYINATKNIT